MKTVYRIVKKSGYECILEVTPLDDYIHVTFSTSIEVPDRKPEPRRQFEMFMEPQELHRLITALTMAQYDWHQHNTTQEV